MVFIASDPAPALPSTPLRTPSGPGRPYPPDIIASVHALIEDTGLSRREAAARAGLRVDTVGRWARRFGWRRADSLPPHAEVPRAAGPRSTRDARACFEARLRRAPQHEEGGGLQARAGSAESTSRRRHPGPDVHEAARVRVEGSRDGLERIADELGIARWTLHRWQKRFGWRRPAPPAKAGPSFYRSRRFGRAYGGDAVRTARDLVTGSALPLGRVAARAGVSRTTLYRWIKRGGWTRPRTVASRHRYRPPYGPEVVAAARALYRTTTLPTPFIAARVKATPARVAHWARAGGWTRPHEPDPRR